MINDHLLMFMLKCKRIKSFKDRIFLWWLNRCYPSFRMTDELKYTLLKKGYIKDISNPRVISDGYGGLIPDPNNESEVLQTTLLGEKVIYTRELKSNIIEDFFDKTFVRVVLIISSIYGFTTFFIKIFRYVKDNFIDR